LVIACSEASCDASERTTGASERLARARRAHAVRPSPALAGVVAHSEAMQRALALAERAAPSSATVLVTGETGTGKEVIARALHALGPRAAGPFVAVNCAAFPDALLESELFGHVRGAFTGAERDRRGLFEEAHGGTLFLDEVGETSPPLQAKLLRALQEREVRAVGASQPRKVDVRVVAATNRDLRSAALLGEFREDLYYRLAVLPIELAPLRQRLRDIVPLAEHFLAHHGAREGKPGCSLAPKAKEHLLAHTWPGNVRELENAVLRAIALAEPGEAVTLDALDAERARDARARGEDRDAPSATLEQRLARIEAEWIREALAQHGGRRTATARALGITREGLHKKMKRLGIA